MTAASQSSSSAQPASSTAQPAKKVVVEYKLDMQASQLLFELEHFPAEKTEQKLMETIESKSNDYSIHY